MHPSKKIKKLENSYNARIESNQSCIRSGPALPLTPQSSPFTSQFGFKIGDHEWFFTEDKFRRGNEGHLKLMCDFSFSVANGHKLGNAIQRSSATFNPSLHHPIGTVLPISSTACNVTARFS